MTNVTSVRDQGATTINPLGKDESGASDMVRKIGGVSEAACKTSPLRKRETDDEDREAVLEQEDGDMFMHAEDDIDY